MNTKEKQQKTLVKTLKCLGQKEHLPKDLIALLGETAELQLNSDQGISISLPDLNLSALQPENNPGRAVLAPATLPLDRNHVAAFFLRLIHKITDQEKPDKGKAFPKAMVAATKLIEKAFTNNELDLDKAIDECLQGSGPIMEHWALQTPEAPAALNFLLRASVEPSLTAGVTALAEWLAKHQPKDTICQTGTCPICGSLPHILELREKEGFRFAHCSLCRHDYRIRRLACPVCDNSDTDELKFFTVSQEPGFRVETCDSCKTYIKTIDFRNFDRQGISRP